MPRVAVAFLLLLLGACASDRVQLSSKLPRPLIERIDMPVGVYFDEAFSNFQTEEELPAIGTVALSAGSINEELFAAVLPGMFSDVRKLSAPTGNGNVKAVFVPKMLELQFSLPQQTRSTNYEVWVKYQIRLQQPDGKLIADWPITAYGKSPEDWNPLGARERGLQAAANVALRDAAAALIVSMRDVPEVRRWLEDQLQPGSAVPMPAAPTASTASPATAGAEGAGTAAAENTGTGASAASTAPPAATPPATGDAAPAPAAVPAAAAPPSGAAAAPILPAASNTGAPA